MRIFMPADEHESMRALSDDQIQQFIRDGFVRIDRAFPRELADEARTILWRDTGCDPHNRATWTKPGHPAFRLQGRTVPEGGAHAGAARRVRSDRRRGPLAPGLVGLRGHVCRTLPPFG